MQRSCLCFFIIQALTTLWQFQKWVKEEARIQRTDLKRKRSWADIFEPSVIDLIGWGDILMQSETTEIGKLLTEDEYVYMIPKVTTSFHLGSQKSILLTQLAYT